MTDETVWRSVFTNEVIRAIGALARQQNVCREQAGQAVFVTGMEAAREYIVEHLRLCEQAGCQGPGVLRDNDGPVDPLVHEPTRQNEV